MAVQHIVIGWETTSGTWEAPSNAISVENWPNNLNKEYTDLQGTGSHHALKKSWDGAFAPAGSCSMDLYEDWIVGILALAGFTDISTAQVAATTAYAHQLLPNPADSLITGSAQAQHGTADSQNWRGLAINKLTFSCKAKEPARLAFDWLALDAGITGNNWAGDGTSAPAIIASPTYLGDGVGVLHFASVTITKDATLALNTSTNVVTPTGGSSITVAEMAEITIENNLNYKHMLGLVKNPTIINRQNRKVSGKLELDFTTFDETWTQAMLGGSYVTLQFAFTGSTIDTGETYELTITLPRVTIRGGNLPDITGNQASRTQTVEFTAEVDPAFVDTNGYPYDIHIECHDDSTTWTSF